METEGDRGHYGPLEHVPPSGGFLEIGNWSTYVGRRTTLLKWVPPSGGFLEIGNDKASSRGVMQTQVPPSGGFLEIGNSLSLLTPRCILVCSPFGGIPRNWKHLGKPFGLQELSTVPSSPFGGIPRNWKPGNLQVGVLVFDCSPFGGIPRNWKPKRHPGVWSC